MQAVQPGQQQPWPPLASAQPLQIAPAACMQRQAATQGAHTGRLLRRDGPALGLPPPLLDTQPNGRQIDALEVKSVLLCLLRRGGLALGLPPPLLDTQPSGRQIDALEVKSASLLLSLCQLAVVAPVLRLHPIRLPG